MKVNVFMGDEKVEDKEIKKYLCVSEVVKNAVDEAYYGYLDGKAKKKR